MGAGLRSVEEHIEVLARVAEAVSPDGASPA